MTYIFGLAFASLTAIVVLAGDFALKLAADRGHTGMSSLVMTGVALYAISALCWFWSVRHISLTQAGVAYSMLTLLALVLIGTRWFGEVLGPRELAGIGCALAAMILLAKVG